MKTALKLLLSIHLLVLSNCYAQKNIALGILVGPNWGDCNLYPTSNGNIMLEKHKLLVNPKIDMFLEYQIKGNFYIQTGLGVASLKSEIKGDNMGIEYITDTDGIIENPRDIYVKYNYTATEVLRLQYLRIPISGSYKLRLSSRFKLIYGLGIAYGILLQKENRAVEGPKLISDRKFKNHDFILSAFHMAEITFCKRWGVRFGLYFDKGITNIDNGTMQHENYSANSMYYGVLAGLTYTILKSKAE